MNKLQDSLNFINKAAAVALLIIGIIGLFNISVEFGIQMILLSAFNFVTVFIYYYYKREKIKKETK